MKNITKCAFMLVFAMLMVGCQDGGKAGVAIDNPMPSMYYWRTSLTLNDAERQFLNDQKIGKMYVRMFDVTRNANGELMPNATLEFVDTIPQTIELIPVVFLTENVFDANSSITNEELARLIVKRVGQMLEQNGYEPCHEIQIDFDWTKSNMERYYSFLSEMKKQMAEKQMKLSVTIRLHQLKMQIPPADYGVVMLYNIGNFKKVDETNSILSEANLAPYIDGFKPTEGQINSMPLCLALPIYEWDLLFEEEDFISIVKNLDVSDEEMFSTTDGIHYVAQKYMALPSTKGNERLFPGAAIRHESVSYELLDNVMKQVEAKNDKITSQVILYDLQENNINRYSYEDIKNTFNRN